MHNTGVWCISYQIAKQLIRWVTRWQVIEYTFIQWSAVITRSNIIGFCRRFDNGWSRSWIRGYAQKNTPYLAFAGELSVSFVKIWVKIDRTITVSHCIHLDGSSLSDSHIYRHHNVIFGGPPTDIYMPWFNDHIFSALSIGNNTDVVIKLLTESSWNTASNLWYKAHQTPRLKWFSSCLADDFTQSIEAGC